jgi:hypothetical protein
MNNRILSLAMLSSPHPCSHLRLGRPPHRQLTTLSRDTFGVRTLTYSAVIHRAFLTQVCLHLVLHESSVACLRAALSH